MSITGTPCCPDRRIMSRAAAISRLTSTSRNRMPFSRKYFFAMLQKEQVGVLNTITRGCGFSMVA